ncbi:hypothetical protein [Glaciihabitans sp. UYNi722]|uniref:hypothetical protein n=1 Tax=Glaciihabitans sp. UYNi722 TaxID=3156344 RepID=UPI003397C2EC
MTAERPLTTTRPVRRTSAVGRVIGLVVAVIFTPVGLWALLVGGADVYRTATRNGGLDGIGILLAIVGMALLLAVVQTSRLSSLGLGILSGVITLAGLVAIVWPFGAGEAVRFLGGLSPDLAYGAGRWMSFGLAVALGLVLWGTAVAARIARRSTEVSSASALRGVLSIVFAVVGAASGLGLLWGGGSLVDRAAQTHGTSALGVVFVILGGLLLEGAALTAVISSAGIFVVGALLFIVGMLALVFEGIARVLGDVVGFIGVRTADAAYIAYEFGFVAALGAVLLATAIVVRRNRRSR